MTIKNRSELLIAVQVSSEKLRQYFEHCLQLTNSRTLFNWRISPFQGCQALITDGKPPIEEFPEQLSCIICIGALPEYESSAIKSQRWISVLREDYTFIDLTSALDRSAIFIKESIIHKELASARILQSSINDLKTQGLDCNHRFQLTSWVAPIPPWNCNECQRTLSMLCQKKIDLRTICQYGGIDCDKAIALLEQLQKSGKLVCSCNFSPGDDAFCHGPHGQLPHAERFFAIKLRFKQFSEWIGRGGRIPGANQVAKSSVKLFRVGIFGPMGIGKTTALTSICGKSIASTEVTNSDRAANAKELTTVGAEIGEIDLGGEEKLQLVGCPGQARFRALRQWVVSTSLGALLLVDLNDESAVDSVSQFLCEMDNLEKKPVLVVLSCRPASDIQQESFSAELEKMGHGAIPVIPTDVRDRQQFINALGIIVSLYSITIRSNHQSTPCFMNQ